MTAPSLSRALVWAAAVLPAAALGLGVGAPTWPARRFVILYVAPMLLVAPLWARHVVDERERSRPAALAVDATVLTLSALRLVAGGVLPFSGHMLFLTYAALTTRRPWLRLVALVLLAVGRHALGRRPPARAEWG